MGKDFSLSTLSIVVPCYNEESALPIFVSRVEPILDELAPSRWELIFVDDGSGDSTLTILEDLSEHRVACKFLSFSRNFGKEAAILAGLRESKGDFVAVMDADLQDPPELLSQMFYSLTNEPFDCVATRRVSRVGEPVIRSVLARAFYRLFNKISEVEIVDGARDYRLMNRSMVDAILALPEYNRFSKGIFSWVGFRTKWLEFANTERVSGVSKWSFWKLFRYSVEGIIAFSTAPLAVASVLGILFCLFAFTFIVFIVVRRILFGDPVAGWASLICIVTFMGGLQMTMLGVIGQYLAKTYLETKRRPSYVIRSRSNRDR